MLRANYSSWTALEEARELESLSYLPPQLSSPFFECISRAMYQRTSVKAGVKLASSPWDRGDRLAGFRAVAQGTLSSNVEACLPWPLSFVRSF